MKYRVVVERSEVIVFEVEADSEDEADDQHLAGEEISSRTTSYNVTAIEPAT
ncbi:hypothetical protein [Kineococcus radiotolerans]|uniref:Uncharacterized protein n=1 Tax=Kineococcus radiotolerans (strain ATCC BAA-149 / DSM 14245 / SRS30216) TaxID=266940 RepID=A6WH58_KINRD|nr:hypothetical protein [Kineococcus radiotolerans]ABS06147.1 hypothetical protein Krad_4689 [Kineococcus radiotolerans SRS30216 = ATCC BAA-149]